MSPAPIAPAMPRSLAAAQAGDEVAFADLFNDTVGDVRRTIDSTLRNPRLAVDDVVSETYLRAWRYLPSFQVRSADFAAWLCTIARRCSIDAIRKDTTARTELKDTDWWDRQTTAAVSDGEGHDLLHDAIRALPPQQRRCVLLRFFGGYTVAEAAEMLDISTSACKSLQLRAVRGLGRHLASEEGMA